MPDEINGQPTPGADAGDSEQQNADNTDNQNDVASLPSWAQELIGGLRKENANRRQSLREMEAQQREFEQQQLAEQGRWKELAEKRGADLQKLAPYQERAQSLEAMIRKGNETRIGSMPEQYHQSLKLLSERLSPEDMAAHLAEVEPLYQKPIAPSLDGGAGGGSQGDSLLTDDERKMARKFKLTDEQVLKTKEKLNSQE